MRNFLVKNIIGVLLVLSLSACAKFELRQKAEDSYKNSRVGLQKNALFIDNKRLDSEISKNFLGADDKNIEIVKFVLKLLTAENDGAKKSYRHKPIFEDKIADLQKSNKLISELGRYIDSIENSDLSYEGPIPIDELNSRLRSIGGFNGILALKALVECNSGLPAQLIRLGDQKLIGKIFEYTFNHQANSGYIGYIAENRISCNGIEKLNDVYVVHVAVIPYHHDSAEPIESKGFHILKRDENGQFPGSDIFLPDDPDVQNRIEHLDYKLHARGRSIRIISAFKNEKLLPKSHPIYHQDKTSCIDIMFEKEPPNYELPLQEAYCMGRCDQPPIINTGF